MKHLLMLIWNLILYIWWCLINIVFVIWYGKLPKVSIYHHFTTKHRNDYSLKDEYNDPLIQAKHCIDIDEILNNYVTYLSNTEDVFHKSSYDNLKATGSFKARSVINDYINNLNK